MRSLSPAPFLLAALLGLSGTAPAQLSVTEYLIPRNGAFPHDPAVGKDGIVWYADQNLSYVGRFDPATGIFTDWPTPTPNSGPHGITVAPDGWVWYTGERAGRLGRVDPVSGAITEYVMPANASRPHTPIAHQGAIWLTCQNNDTYARFDPVTLQTRVYNAPSGSRPYGIAAAADGSLWIALFGTNRLGQVDPATGALKLHTLPSSSARPRRLTVSNDGIVWYTDYNRSYLGRLDPATGAVREWRTPGSRPYGIAIGTDSRVWFHDGGANRMVAFDPRTARMETVVVPTAGPTVRNMVCDFPRGRLWLALSGTQRLGSIQLDVPVQFFGTACTGSAGTPSFAVAGLPRIGETMTFSVGNTAATSGALFFGVSDSTWNGLPLPLDLGPYGSAGCLVNSSWDVGLSAAPLGPVPFTVPVNLSFGGAVVFAQWALLGDPSGRTVVTTTAAKLTVIGL